MRFLETATEAKATITGLLVAMFPAYFIISWFGVNGYILAPVAFIVTASVVRAKLIPKDQNKW